MPDVARFKANREWINAKVIRQDGDQLRVIASVDVENGRFGEQLVASLRPSDTHSGRKITLRGRNIDVLEAHTGESNSDNWFNIPVRLTTEEFGEDGQHALVVRPVEAVDEEPEDDAEEAEDDSGIPF